MQAPDKRSWTTLHVAAKYNRKDILKMLLDKEENGIKVADIREKTDRGITPLHVAATEGDTAIMQVLLDHFKENSKGAAPRVVSACVC